MKYFTRFGWFVIACIITLLFAVLSLTGCGIKQNPTAPQIVYQINDNSQITQIVGDGNTTTAKADSKVDQTAKPDVKQSSESTTENGMWKIYLILIVAAVVGIIIYRKKIIEFLKKIKK